MIRSFDWDRHGVFLVTVIMVLTLFLAPQFSDLFMLLQMTYRQYGDLRIEYGIYLGLWWNNVFGQSAFFGLGAYAYAIAESKFRESTIPFLLYRGS